MPLLSRYAQGKKSRFFLRGIPKHCKILEIGCGDGWVRKYLNENGWNNYIGLDLVPPADVVGNILDWRAMGCSQLKESSFDVIIAFEVLEHVNCMKECYELLKPGGILMLTSPLPHMDWLMRFLERIGLNQKRTSPHVNLTDFKKIPFFKEKHIKTIGFLSQWGVFVK